MCLSLAVGSLRTQHLCFIESADAPLRAFTLGPGEWLLVSLNKSFWSPGGIPIIPLQTGADLTLVLQELSQMSQAAYNLEVQFRCKPSPHGVFPRVWTIPMAEVERVSAPASRYTSWLHSHEAIWVNPTDKGPCSEVKGTLAAVHHSPPISFSSYSFQSKAKPVPPILPESEEGRCWNQEAKFKSQLPQLLTLDKLLIFSAH